MLNAEPGPKKVLRLEVKYSAKSLGRERRETCIRNVREEKRT